MIRPAEPDDTSAVIALAVSSGLFGEDDVDAVRSLMEDYFVRTRAQGHACLVDVDDAVPGGGEGEAAGVAYVQPTAGTDRTWTLLMIAVRRDLQGQGRGTRLLREVEDQLRRRQQRLLLVETSGTTGFARTRAFYDRAGYHAEARVRDYYEAGDDMVLYRKDLATPASSRGQ